MKERIKAWAQKLTFDVTALYLAYQREDVPWYAKLAAIAAVAYALSPIDLIPDFIPVLGYLDDLLILPFLIFIAVKLIPSEVMEECRNQAPELWKNGKPKKWYYAIPILLIWLLIVAVIVRIIWF